MEEAEFSESLVFSFLKSHRGSEKRTFCEGKKFLFEEKSLRKGGEDFLFTGKHFRIAGKHFRIAEKHFRIVGKRFRIAGKYFRIVGKHFRIAGEHFLLAGKHFRKGEFFENCKKLNVFNKLAAFAAKRRKNV